MTNTLTKKEQWLDLACSEERPNLLKPHGCAASDGIRMHIENNNGACRCGDEKQHKAFDNIIETVKNIPFAFAINKTFLLDALDGISPDGNYVLFFIKDSKSSIVLQDPDGNETAIIMPLRIIDTPKPQNLPHVTPIKISKVSRYSLVSDEVE